MQNKHFPTKNVFSDCVSNETLKRVQSELMTQIDDKLISFQDAEKERFSEMKEILQKIQDGFLKQAQKCYIPRSDPW